MAEPSESILTRATRRAMERMEAIAERVEEALEIPFGRELVSNRKIRATVRQALPKLNAQGIEIEPGDPQAVQQLEQWAQAGGHQEGEPVLCELCRQINYVFNTEYAGKLNSAVDSVIEGLVQGAAL